MRRHGRFLIKIFTGREELGRVVFRITPRANVGRAEYAGGKDPELDAIMGTIVRRRLWGWLELSATLRRSLTMMTGARYVLRFHETPAPDGRGGDEALRKCFRLRAGAMAELGP